MASLDYFGEQQFRDESERQRDHTVCAGCGTNKPRGMIVCWDCFKRGPVPYKYFGGAWAEWLAAVRK